MVHQSALEDLPLDNLANEEQLVSDFVLEEQPLATLVPELTEVDEQNMLAMFPVQSPAPMPVQSVPIPVESVAMPARQAKSTRERPAFKFCHLDRHDYDFIIRNKPPVIASKGCCRHSLESLE